MQDRSVGGVGSYSITMTKMQIKQGDILQSKQYPKSTIKILGTCGDLLAISWPDAYEASNRWCTVEELLKCYTLIEPEWEPAEEERYWFITNLGEVETNLWDGVDFDKKLKNFLGIYQTKEKAEQALEVIKSKLK